MCGGHQRGMIIHAKGRCDLQFLVATNDWPSNAAFAMRLRACVCLRCFFVVWFCFALSFCAPWCLFEQGYQPFFLDRKGFFKLRPTHFVWSVRISPLTCTPKHFWEIRLILGVILFYPHPPEARWGTEIEFYNRFFHICPGGTEH